MSVGSNDEITRMNTSLLITDFDQHTCLLIHRENGNAIGFQAIGRIEELPVGRQVDVRTSLGIHRIGLDVLNRMQSLTIIY